MISTNDERYKHMNLVALIVADKQFILFKTILHTNAICDKKSEYFVSYRYFNEVVILV